MQQVMLLPSTHYLLWHAGTKIYLQIMAIILTFPTTVQ